MDVQGILTPSIYDPLARIQLTASPIPPAFFEIIAHRRNVSKIPSILSSHMVNK
jgi:hypothetical protein